MGMKHRISKVDAGVAVAGLLAVSGAVPAQALTDSGRQDCSAGGGYVGARGEQQRYGDRMSFDVGGRTTKVVNRYTYGFDSGLRMSQNWRVSSESLLLSGTYGYCYYPY